MTGFIKVNRELWDHPAFREGPMSQREAFIWMIADAAWKPRTVRRGDVVLELERGQLAHSIRYLAEAFQWSKSTVQRFIKTLESRDMVRSESGTGVTLITICNYDKYQGGEQACGTAAGQQRDSSGTNYKKDKKLEEDNTSDFERFWTAYPRKQGTSKPKALDAFRKLDPGEQKQALATVEAFARSVAQTEERYVPHAATWLNQRRFETLAEQSAEVSPIVWGVALRAYRDRGSWPRHLGPAPDERGCKCPAEILAEFGYTQSKELKHG